MTSILVGWLPSMHHTSYDQGGSAYRGSLPTGGVLRPGGSAYTRTSAYKGGGEGRPPRTRKAGGRHPTGTLSC